MPTSHEQNEELLLYAAAFVFAVARLCGVTHVLYKDAVHAFVFTLLGAWLVGRKPLYGDIVVGLSALEVVCFVYTLASR